jgi:hypothetical protein
MSGKGTGKRKWQRKEKGQGLVEFALVLPALLLVLMGIADFGRLMAVYSNIYNAAREGVRFGVVNPQDVVGITQAARNNIKMLAPESVDVFVEYDSGPGTPPISYNAVSIGDRVIVTLDTDVDMITPLVQAITGRFRLETVAARTISGLGAIGNGTAPPAPPTYTSDGSDTATPSPTPTETPTATPTATLDPSVTPPATAGILPIQITRPLWQGDQVVRGTAQPDEVVNLRDIQNPNLNLSTTVNPDGTFQFDVPPLVAGHVIAVQGYGNIDYAYVEGAITPTASATPTGTPTPTATPTNQYIVISPTCGPVGQLTILVNGYQWPINRGALTISWDGVEVVQVDLGGSPDFSVEITVDAAAGSHTLMVATADGAYTASQTVLVPCVVTPTATPSQPNLVVESISLGNEGTIKTYDPLTFTVAVRNVGAAAANSLFWVDLYLDPAQTDVDGLQNEVGVSWAAVSSLAANERISLTLEHLAGLTTTGDHYAYAFADSWDQVLENAEDDNVGGPVSVTVELVGVPPTPTPTPTPGGNQVGAISGSTWLYISGDIVPQGRVNVYVYDGVDLVAETLSGHDGDYVISNLPEGTYTVIGETFIDGELYTHVVMGVDVLAGQTTEYVTLVLH